MGRGNRSMRLSKDFDMVFPQKFDNSILFRQIIGINALTYTQQLNPDRCIIRCIVNTPFRIEVFTISVGHITQIYVYSISFEVMLDFHFLPPLVHHRYYYPMLRLSLIDDNPNSFTRRRCTHIAHTVIIVSGWIASLVIPQTGFYLLFRYASFLHSILSMVCVMQHCCINPSLLVNPVYHLYNISTTYSQYQPRFIRTILFERLSG